MLSRRGRDNPERQWKTRSRLARLIPDRNAVGGVVGSDDVRVSSAGTEAFVFQKPPQGTPGVLKQGRWSGVLDGGAFGFEAGAEFPDEGGEFAGDGGLDLVVVHASFAQQGEAVAEARLGFPGELLDPARGVPLSF